MSMFSRGAALKFTVDALGVLPTGDLVRTFRWTDSDIRFGQAPPTVLRRYDSAHQLFRPICGVLKGPVRYHNAACTVLKPDSALKASSS